MKQLFTLFVILLAMLQVAKAQPKPQGTGYFQRILRLFPYSKEQIDSGF